MIKGISLTASMRSNLLSLRNISTQMDKIQNILSTGKKVNSAIDNASSYYQARSLTNRASDLNSLLDSMGQGIQTIQAASEGLESATSYLEQMKSVAEQALTLAVTTQISDDKDKDVSIRPIEEFEALGYTVVPTYAGASEIEALITDGATKLVLSGDVTLSESLDIGTSDVVIEGNGHKLVYNSTSGGSAIVVDGSDSIAEISNLIIEISGSDVIGIQVLNGGSVIIDNPSNIKVSGTESQMFQNGNDDAVNLYAGKANTQAIVNQLGTDGRAAYATTQFYVGDKNGEFGQGKWYLPSIGELIDMYGTDTSAMTNGLGTSGAENYNNSNMKLINDALETLAEQDESVAEKISGYHWSSSTYDNDLTCFLTADNGNRANNYKDGYSRVRCFQHLENFFDYPSFSNNELVIPQIGDVVYSDKSYGSANAYDGSKTAVGIICDVGEDGSVKIVNLKDLRFNNGNFDPDNPYSGSSSSIYWATNAKSSEDITAITSYDSSGLLNAMKSTGTIVIAASDISFISDDISAENVENITTYSLRKSVPEQDAVSVFDEILELNTEPTTTFAMTRSLTEQIEDNPNVSYGDYINQYEHILGEFNTLIKDASYQGVNLLTGGEMNVTFNETRTHSFNVKGEDIRSDKIGLTTINWSSKSDVETAIKEITNAINEVRNFSADLGNKYTIIQTRQSFTEALSDILEVGADKLTLADMNETSAEYLMLQTRQQLAVNSLSLASQSAKSILSLF